MLCNWWKTMIIALFNFNVNHHSYSFNRRHIGERKSEKSSKVIIPFGLMNLMLFLSNPFHFMTLQFRLYSLKWPLDKSDFLKGPFSKCTKLATIFYFYLNLKCLKKIETANWMWNMGNSCVINSLESRLLISSTDQMRKKRKNFHL